MVLLIEGIILSAVFTLMVFVMSRKPINTLYNYPPKIQERVKSLDEYKAAYRHRRTRSRQNSSPAYCLL